MPKAALPTRYGKRWRIRWLDHHGKRQSEILDSFEEAERLLREHQVESGQIRPGQRSAPPPVKTFNALADYWLVHRTDKRSLADDRSVLRQMRPALGHLHLTALTVEDVDDYRRQQESRGLAPKTIGNHLALLHAMLNLAVDLGWLLQALRTQPASYLRMPLAPQRRAS